MADHAASRIDPWAVVAWLFGMRLCWTPAEADFVARHLRE